MSCDRRIRLLRAVIRIDVTLEMVDDLAHHLQEVGLPKSSSQCSLKHCMPFLPVLTYSKARSACESSLREGFSGRMTLGAAN